MCRRSPHIQAHDAVRANDEAKLRQCKACDSTDADRVTPIMLAAENGHYFNFQYLLIDCKAVLDATDSQGRSILHFLTASPRIESGHLRIFDRIKQRLREDKTLTSDGFPFSATDNHGITPIHNLVKSGPDWDSTNSAAAKLMVQLQDLFDRMGVLYQSRRVCDWNADAHKGGRRGAASAPGLAPVYIAAELGYLNKLIVLRQIGAQVNEFVHELPAGLRPSDDRADTAASPALGGAGRADESIDMELGSQSGATANTGQGNPESGSAPDPVYDDVQGMMYGDEGGDEGGDDGLYSEGPSPRFREEEAGYVDLPDPSREDKGSYDSHAYDQMLIDDPYSGPIGEPGLYTELPKGDPGEKYFGETTQALYGDFDDPQRTVSSKHSAIQEEKLYGEVYNEAMSGLRKADYPALPELEVATAYKTHGDEYSPYGFGSYLEMGPQRGGLALDLSSGKKGKGFGQFLNENVAPQPSYGEIAVSEAQDEPKKPNADDGIDLALFVESKHQSLMQRLKEIAEQLGRSPEDSSYRRNRADAYSQPPEAGSDWYAIHSAASSGHETIVQELLQDRKLHHTFSERFDDGTSKGTDPFIRDTKGRTPLHYACETGRVEIVEVLFRQWDKKYGTVTTGYNYKDITELPNSPFVDFDFEFGTPVGFATAGAGGNRQRLHRQLAVLAKISMLRMPQSTSYGSRLDIGLSIPAMRQWLSNVVSTVSFQPSNVPWKKKVERLQSAEENMRKNACAYVDAYMLGKVGRNKLAKEVIHRPTQEIAQLLNKGLKRLPEANEVTKVLEYSKYNDIEKANREAGTTSDSLRERETDRKVSELSLYAREQKQRIKLVPLAEAFMMAYQQMGLKHRRVQNGDLPLRILEGGRSLTQLCYLAVEIKGLMNTSNATRDVELYEMAHSQVQATVAEALQIASSAFHIKELRKLLLDSPYNDQVPTLERSDPNWLFNALMASKNRVAIASPACQRVAQSIWMGSESQDNDSDAADAKASGLVTLNNVAFLLRGSRGVFWRHQIVRFIFVALLAYVASVDSTDTPSEYEILAAVYIVGLFVLYIQLFVARWEKVQERKCEQENIDKGLKCSPTHRAVAETTIEVDTWVVADICALLFATPVIMLRIYCYAENDSGDALEASNYLLGCCVVLFVLRSLECLMLVRPLGTLLITIERIFPDVVRWAVLQLALLIAFTLGIIKTMEELGPDEAKGFWDVSRDLYFSIYGLVELEDYSEPKVTLGLYGLYLVLSAVLLLNLLIAMLNLRYVAIENKADLNYKFRCTKMILQYQYVMPRLPPPFSVFSGVIESFTASQGFTYGDLSAQNAAKTAAASAAGKEKGPWHPMEHPHGDSKREIMCKYPELTTVGLDNHGAKFKLFDLVYIQPRASPSTNDVRPRKGVLKDIARVYQCGFCLLWFERNYFSDFKSLFDDTDPGKFQKQTKKTIEAMFKECRHRRVWIHRAGKKPRLAQQFSDGVLDKKADILCNKCLENTIAKQKLHPTWFEDKLKEVERKSNPDKKPHAAKKASSVKKRTLQPYGAMIYPGRDFSGKKQPALRYNGARNNVGSDPSGQGQGWHAIQFGIELLEPAVSGRHSNEARYANTKRVNEGVEFASRPDTGKTPPFSSYFTRPEVYVSAEKLGPSSESVYSVLEPHDAPAVEGLTTDVIKLYDVQSELIDKLIEMRQGIAEGSEQSTLEELAKQVSALSLQSTGRATEVASTGSGGGVDSSLPELHHDTVETKLEGILKLLEQQIEPETGRKRLQSLAHDGETSKGRNGVKQKQSELSDEDEFGSDSGGRRGQPKTHESFSGFDKLSEHADSDDSTGQDEARTFDEAGGGDTTGGDDGRRKRKPAHKRFHIANSSRTVWAYFETNGALASLNIVLHYLSRFNDIQAKIVFTAHLLVWPFVGVFFVTNRKCFCWV